MTDIGLRSIFDEDHDMYRQTVRRFFQDEVAPQHAKYVFFCCYSHYWACLFEVLKP